MQIEVKVKDVRERVQAERKPVLVAAKPVLAGTVKPPQHIVGEQGRKEREGYSQFHLKKRLLQ